MVIENLDNVLSNKTITDLKPVIDESNSNLISPTIDELELIISKFKLGESVEQVRREVFRLGDDGVAKLTFSKNQLIEIKNAVNKKIAELSDNVGV